MKGKRIFYSEIAYCLGIIILALGTALMEKADFGMSMVVAPAYLLHLKISQFLPFYSFGMSEYVFQAFLLIVLSIVMKKVKKIYFLSFATAFIYGLVLDLTMALTGLISKETLILQIVFYLMGMVICSVGVALLFHTYLPPEAYELFVKELSEKTNTSIAKTKTIYDICGCILALILSVVFFKDLVGIKWGTFVCAVINGWLIGRISAFLDKNFLFKDALNLRNKI